MSPTDDFVYPDGATTQTNFTHAWGLAWAVDCTTSGARDGSWFYPGGDVSSSVYAPCVNTTTNPSHVYAADLTAMLDQLAALGTEVADKVVSVCKDVVQPQETEVRMALAAR